MVNMVILHAFDIKMSPKVDNVTFYSRYFIWELPLGGLLILFYITKLQYEPPEPIRKLNKGK